MKRDPERGMRAFFILRAVLLSLLVAISSALPFSGCVKRTRNAISPSTSRSQTGGPTPERQSNASENDSAASASRININTASVNELEKLPGIGKGWAEGIVKHP